MTPGRGRLSAWLAAAAALACACAALPAPASAAAAPDAPPVLSGFRLTPVTLRPPSPGAFRFFTTREGAGSIALARITRTGRLLPAGRLRFAADAGEVLRRFDGRVGGRRLAPGRYRATVTVVNAQVGPSAPRRLTFRVVG